MEKIIKTPAYSLLYDNEKYLLYTIGNKISIFDVSRNFKKVKVLDDLRDPNQIVIDKKEKMLIAKNTTGSFAFYDLEDFSLQLKLKLEGVSNTDDDFIYNTESKTIYVIMSCSVLCELGFKLAVIDIKTNNVNYYPLEFGVSNYILARYSIHKSDLDFLYLFRTIADIEKAIIVESSYGKYRLTDKGLEEEKTLYKSSNDLSNMKTFNADSYNYVCYFDTKLCKFYDFKTLNINSKKDYVEDISAYKNIYALTTSDKIYFTSDFKNIIDTINGKYLSCYLETDEYKFVGSWESLKIISK